jgi:Zn-dependent peptidase ImmA (M78 family)/transcriptional regulator with XRE-family HTH domain
MKLGTPGFVGGRLREAREARGLSQTALAEILGVTRAAVSQYEAGSATPRPEILERISQVLNFPPHFFSRPVPQRAAPAVFYRSMSSATKVARAKAERRFLWMADDFVPYLGQFVELPKVNFPDLPLPADLLVMSDNQIEDVAATVRRFWGLGEGPISNVVWLLENNGAIVTRGYLEVADLDSFCAWVASRPYVFLNADKQSAARSRFDAAHELAHLILHRGIEGRRLERRADHAILERQAHRFAAAFLLPARSFLDAVYMPTLDAFRALKPIWRVSIGMMIMRAEHLNLISQEQSRRLWVAYSRRGWKRGEPLDPELPAEEPRLQRSAFELLIGEGVQTPDDVLLNLGLPATDIEAVAGLQPGYVSEAPPEARLLEFPTQRSVKGQHPTPTAGELVPFAKSAKRGHRAT